MKARSRTPNARMSTSKVGGRTPSMRQSVTRIGVENLIPESVRLEEQGAFNTTHKIARTPVKGGAPSPAKPVSKSPARLASRSPFADRTNQKSPARAKPPMSPAVAGRVKTPSSSARSKTPTPVPVVVKPVVTNTSNVSVVIPPPLSLARSTSQPTPLSRKSVTATCNAKTAAVAVAVSAPAEPVVMAIPTVNRRHRNDDTVVVLAPPETPLPFEPEKVVGLNKEERAMASEVNDVLNNSSVSAAPTPAALAPFSPLGEQMETFNESEETEVELEKSINTSICFIEQILERKLAPNEFRRLAQEMRSPATAGTTFSSEVLETIQKRRISYGICSMAGENDTRRKSIRQSIVPATASRQGEAVITPVTTRTTTGRASLSPSCSEVINELKGVLSAFIVPGASTTGSAVKTPAQSSTLFKVSYKLRGFQGAEKTSPVHAISTSAAKATKKSPAGRKARKSTVHVQADLNLAKREIPIAEATICEAPEESTETVVTAFAPRRTLQRSPQDPAPQSQLCSPRPSAKTVMSSDMLASLQSKLDGVVQSLPLGNRRSSNVPVVNGDAFIQELVKNSPVQLPTTASLEDNIVADLMATVSASVSPKAPPAHATPSSSAKSPKVAKSSARATRCANVQHSPPAMDIASPVPTPAPVAVEEEMSPQQQHDAVAEIMKSRQSPVSEAPVVAVTANEERLTQRLQQLEQQLCVSLQSFDEFKMQSKEEIGALQQAKLDAELSVCRENLDKLSAAQFILEQKELLREERRARMRAEVAIALLSTRLTESIEKISDLVAGKEVAMPVVSFDAAPAATQPTIESSPCPADAISPAECFDHDDNMDYDCDMASSAASIKSVSKSLISEFDDDKGSAVKGKKGKGKNVSVHTRFSDNSEIESTYEAADMGMDYGSVEGTDEDRRLIQFALDSAKKTTPVHMGAKMPKKGTPFHGAKVSKAVAKATSKVSKSSWTLASAAPKDPLTLKYSGGLTNLRFVPLTKKVKTVKPLGDGWLDEASEGSPMQMSPEDDKKKKAMPAAKVSRAAFSPIAKVSRSKVEEVEEEEEVEQQQVEEQQVESSPKKKGKKGSKTTKMAGAITEAPLVEQEAEVSMEAASGKRKKPSRSHETSNLKLIPLKTKATTKVSVAASVPTGPTLTLAEQLSAVDPEDLFSPAKSPPLKRAARNSRKAERAEVEEPDASPAPLAAKTKAERKGKGKGKSKVASQVVEEAVVEPVVEPEVTPAVAPIKEKKTKASKAKATKASKTKVAKAQEAPVIAAEPEPAPAPAAAMQNISSISLKDSSLLDDKSFEALRIRASMVGLIHTLGLSSEYSCALFYIYLINCLYVLACRPLSVPLMAQFSVLARQKAKASLFPSSRRSKNMSIAIPNSVNM